MFLLYNFHALGTIFNIETFEEISKYDSQVIESRLKQEIIEFESLYSRFKKDSLVTKLNTCGFLLNPTEELIEMVSLGTKIGQLTNGVFNLCVGAVLEGRGYGEVFDTKQILNNFLDIPLKINSKKITIKEGYKLDLGGIGKSYLINKLAGILEREFRLRYFLINGGGDIYVTSNYEKEVVISLQNPVSKNEVIGEVSLKNKSICGSSPFLRSWLQDGDLQNHFVDPFDTYRKSFNSCFVIGEDIIICDALATSICINKDCIDESIRGSYTVILIEEKLLE